MENEENLEEVVLPVGLEEETKLKADEIKKVKKLKRVYPIIIVGDETDEKEFYVVYLKEPSFKDFSKFSALGRTNEMQAMRTLASDCFVGGDREAIDDDSLFMTGLMANVMTIVKFRKSKVVNLSKAGK